jgi:hypothetical protein
MSATLSAELVRELERAGDRPLPVMNPDTKRRYVLVDIERYDVVQRPSVEMTWSEKNNERRCGLIRKKFTQGIDEEEVRELSELQDSLSDYRKKTVPLPYDAVDALRAALQSNTPTTES